MAATYRPSQALDYAKQFIKNMNVEKVQARLLDDVNKIIWMAAPWRWTVGVMTPVTLLSSTQDYTITIPTDFLYLLDAYISDGTSLRPLDVFPILPATSHVGSQSSQVAITGTTLRVFPKPGALPSVVQNIYLIYKKVSPSITESSVTTAGKLVMDDDWFSVYNEGVLWKFYQYADDERAGGATVTGDGKVQYAGQMGIFMAALEGMKDREKLPKFDFRMVPEPPARNK